MISFQVEQPRTKPVYLIGGFKNGSKMNDVYKLNQAGATFTWELLEIAGAHPEPRSSFAACLSSDTSFYLFGGSGENNAKYNDLWQFNGKSWVKICGNTAIDAEDGAHPDSQPLHKSGHQIALHKDRYILVFGGIHEVTYEMNDFKAFDLQTKHWRTIDEENKNASESGSPKNKQMIQATDSLKKKFTIKNEQTIIGLDTTLSSSQQSPKKGDNHALGKTSPSNRFNNNPFLTIKNRSLSQTKRMEATMTQEASKEGEKSDELLTPTSISMKNAFIIKNADASFDHYFHMMKKRKSPHASPSKLTGTGQIQFAPHHQHGKEETGSKIKIISDKQPPSRDGHSASLHQGKWIVFGGDRHHMPFNDTYVLNLSKLALE